VRPNGSNGKRIMWQMRNTRCTWIPDARLKLRIGSWLVGGNAVNFHCLRADMHLEGCIVKVQQIKRYFTRRWQLTTNFVVKRIKFYVWTADAGGSFLGKVNKSSSHDCIYVTTWLTPSKNRRSGQRSFTAVPQTDAIVIAPKILRQKFI